ncbi:MAG: hypothetical protein A2W95_00360 [Bacteroidetes bacterium GWA2_40_14]|nr:MAG: hypothetical protein A2W95_00360 [Bacteroidetes bacterium GWA2_40_14]
MRYFIFYIICFYSLSVFAGSNQLSFVHLSVEDGLASTYVKGITQDKEGFIWIATRENICRYDGADFKVFPAYNQQGETVKLIPNTLYLFNDTLLLCENINNYFYYFDFAYECFKPFDPLFSPIKKSELSLINGNEILFIQGNELCRLNLTSQKIVISHLFEKFVSVSSSVAYTSSFATDSRFVATTNNRQILVYNKETSEINEFTIPEEFATEELEIVYVDKYNNIWYRLYNRGLFRLSDDLKSTLCFSVKSKHKILHDLVHCVIMDHKERIWIGNENGLCIWDEKTNEMQNYQYNKLYPQGLNTNPIYNAFKDKNDNIWLGTYFGGINLWNCKEPYFKSWMAGQSPYHLIGNVVSSFAEDSCGNLWIGTEDMGINKLNLETGRIDKDDELKNPIELSYNNVHNLTFVDNDNLWIATYSGGINVFNIKTKAISHINMANYRELPSDFIYTLMLIGDSVFIGGNGGVTIYNLKSKKMAEFYRDQIHDEDVVSFAICDDYLWLASYTNLYVFHLKQQKLTHFDKKFENAGINQVVCDSKKQMWLATNTMGVIKFDYKNDTVTYYNETTGFPVNRIFAFQEGANGSLWVSTTKGLINFNEHTNQYYLYDYSSGVAFNQFNFRANYKDKNGQIYFGGNNGMVAFNEKDSIGEEKIDVVFTEFSLFNKPVAPGKKSPLKMAVNKADKIVLQYKQNVFTINFAAINFTQKGKNMYAYKLEGFDKEYNFVGNRGSATYTNLNPGKYVFKVKASNNSWRNKSDEKSITIIIKPPFWRTWFAYVIYFILLALSLFLFYYIITSIQKSRAMVEIERREKKYMEEMNLAKLEFFTNISHEIKTPLTLILGPLIKLIKEENIPFAAKNNLQGIYRNVKRLNTLLMELLEFRKIERGSMKLTVQHVNGFSFMDDVALNFGTLAKSKNVCFDVDYPKTMADLWFNQSILEKIIYNLLSNAFKYGTSGNYISCKIDVETTDASSTAPKKILRLTVADNGIGIKAENINKLFERFYQVSDGESLPQGVGIGLSFVKSLVELHRGTIEIISEPNKGSRFIVSIPASVNQFAESELSYSNAHNDLFLNEVEPNFYIPKEIETKADTIELLSNKPVIQVVDDNVELLNFIKELLRDHYVVHTAENGEEAYEKICKYNPELIISDVMMPVMDGFELTKRIKENIETSHIPVVLLTAKGGQENCYEGLKFGADLYIEKPFYPPVLEQNISNIINTRFNLKKRFHTDFTLKPADAVHSVRDKEFINKLTEVILEHIDNPNVDVTFLVKHLNVSRSLLHLKLKSLVNCSTTEFVRNIRMRKAVELITQENCSFAEAGYRTGFSSPAYFSRSFKECYGKSPREYFNQ